MSNNSKIGGIFSIISGGIGAIGGFLILAVAFMFRSAIDVSVSPFYYDYDYYYADEFFSVFVVVYVIIGIVTLAISALGVVGGIYALKRQNWGLALAGSIAGCLTFFFCGVPAVVFIAMAKPEFDANKIAAPPL